MSHKYRWTRSALGAVVGLVVLALAPGVDGGGKKGEAKHIEGKKESATPAASVNFTKDLGLDFPSLTTLGARIDAARQVADPVALAALGQELAIAEKVSGKTASVKAADINKEAAELATVRFNAAELKAVSHYTGDKDLLAVADKAAKDEQAAIKARESGEKSRGIQGTLHVDSRVKGVSINVYVDGRYVGTVPPYGDRYYYIGQTAGETTFLSARSVDGSMSWRNPVGRAVGDFHWTLTP